MDPNDHLRGPSIPVPQNQNFKEQLQNINQPYTSENIFIQIVQQIKRFEKTLDKEHEVGMQLVCFGQSIQFTVARMGYMNPCIIWFDGVLADGSTVQLVQHVNQINFLLMAVKLQDPEQPKSLIGFCRPSQQHERGFQEFDPFEIPEPE